MSESIRYITVVSEGYSIHQTWGNRGGLFQKQDDVLAMSDVGILKEFTYTPGGPVATWPCLGLYWDLTNSKCSSKDRLSTFNLQEMTGMLLLTLVRRGLFVVECQIEYQRPGNRSRDS